MRGYYGLKSRIKILLLTIVQNHVKKKMPVLLVDVDYISLFALSSSNVKKDWICKERLQIIRMTLEIDWGIQIVLTTWYEIAMWLGIVPQALAKLIWIHSLAQ